MSGIDWAAELTAPKQAEPQQGGIDWVAEMTGGSKAAPAPQSDKEGWGEWAVKLPYRAYKAAKGEQDPAYKDLKSFDDMPAAGGSEYKMRATGGVLSGVDDAGYGDIIQKSLGKNFIRRFKDANGYEIIEHRGPDGKPAMAYVNKPGLDFNDVSRGVVGAVPYVASGGVLGSMGKGAGWFVNSVLQGAGAGATNLAAQGGRQASGSDQSLDAAELGITSAAGFAGPTASAFAGDLWRRFVTIPGLIDASGKLTPKGLAAVKAAGLDPASVQGDMAKEFAKTYAKTGDAAAAGLKTEARAYGVETTLGQRTKDPQQLLREKNLRFGLEGQAAKDVMTGFDARQSEQIERMVRGNGLLTGGTTKVEPSMLERLAPNKPYVSLNPGVIGDDIRGGVQRSLGSAKSQEAAAWRDVKPMTPKPEAFSDLPEIISDKLKQAGGGSEFRITSSTPKALEMDKALARYAAGENVAAETSLLKQAPLQTTEDMRRHLKNMMMDAATPSDQTATKAIYEGFKEWSVNAAKKMLVDGDPMGAANALKAVDVTRELKQIFNPTGRGFRQNGASRIMSEILDKNDTPEKIVAALFSNPSKTVPKDGAVQALKSIKDGLEKYSPNSAADTWNAVRVAHWSTLIQDAQGNLLSPTVMAKNIQSAMHSHGSVMNTLYTHSEQREIMRVFRVLRGVSSKDPNPSGTASSLGSMARDFLGTLMRALPTPLKVAVEYSKLPQAMGNVSARGAVAQGMPTAHPNWSGQFVGGVDQAYRNK